jgi:hypothetical protein
MRLGSLGMSDRQFLAALTDLSYSAAAFHHGDHLRLGWLLLEQLGLEAAIGKAADLIRAFGAHHGKADLYHETITRGWMRLLASHDEKSFQEFVEKNEPRLTRELLHLYWKPETLYGPDARARWVEPNIRALPEVARRIRGASS